jgi:hypothetical protein
MTMFTIAGPFEIPVHQASAARIIRGNEGNQFFANYKSHALRKGCYVYGVRAGKGITPLYAGLAKKSFEQECFEPHKLGKYNEGLADYNKGTPVMFFVLAPKGKKGRENLTHIKELEVFLIQTGVAANPDLLNVRGTKQQEWGIKGVLRTPPGKPGLGTGAFKKMMKIKKS